jgi:hypothetical protein
VVDAVTDAFASGLSGRVLALLRSIRARRGRLRSGPPMTRRLRD